MKKQPNNQPGFSGAEGGCCCKRTDIDSGTRKAVEALNSASAAFEKKISAIMALWKDDKLQKIAGEMLDWAKHLERAAIEADSICKERPPMRIGLRYRSSSNRWTFFSVAVNNDSYAGDLCLPTKDVGAFEQVLIDGLAGPEDAFSSEGVRIWTPPEE